MVAGAAETGICAGASVKLGGVAVDVACGATAAGRAPGVGETTSDATCGSWAAKPSCTAGNGLSLLATTASSGRLAASAASWVASRVTCVACAAGAAAACCACPLWPTASTQGASAVASSVPASAAAPSRPRPPRPPRRRRPRPRRAGSFDSASSSAAASFVAVPWPCAATKSLATGCDGVAMLVSAVASPATCDSDAGLEPDSGSFKPKLSQVSSAAATGSAERGWRPLREPRSWRSPRGADGSLPGWLGFASLAVGWALAVAVDAAATAPGRCVPAWRPPRSPRSARFERPAWLPAVSLGFWPPPAPWRRFSPCAPASRGGRSAPLLAAWPSRFPSRPRPRLLRLLPPRPAESAGPALLIAGEAGAGVAVDGAEFAASSPAKTLRSQPKKPVPEAAAAAVVWGLPGAADKELAACVGAITGTGVGAGPSGVMPRTSASWRGRSSFSLRRMVVSCSISSAMR